MSEQGPHEEGQMGSEAEVYSSLVADANEAEHLARDPRVQNLEERLAADGESPTLRETANGRSAELSEQFERMKAGAQQEAERDIARLSGLTRADLENPNAAQDMPDGTKGIWIKSGGLNVEGHDVMGLYADALYGGLSAAEARKEAESFVGEGTEQMQRTWSDCDQFEVAVTKTDAGEIHELRGQNTQEQSDRVLAMWVVPDGRR